MAIIFSTTITIINFIFNTEIAKNELFSRLENYLDNPVLSENSEDRVSRLLKKILKDILYTSSKDEERPKSIEDLLSKVLKEAAIPITKSIKDFKDSVTSFQSQVGIFSENTKSIKESFSKLDIGAKSFEKSAIDLEKAVTGIQQHQNNLWEWRNKLADTQTSFATTTKYLGDNIKDLVENNKKATDLAENVYNQLKKSASQFEDSSLYFMEASETIKDSKFADKLLQASDNLADTQTKFAESSLVLSNSTRSIATLISDFQNAITQVVKVGEDIQKLNKVSSEILIVNQENATETKDSFKAIELDLIKLIDSVKEYQYKSILGFQKVGNILISSVSEKLGTNSISLQEVSQTVREYSSNLNAMKQSLEALTANISQVDSQSELKLQTLSALTKEITALHQQSVQMIELNQQQLALENGQLNQIKTELSSLIDQVNNQSSLNLQSLSDLTSEITMVRQQSVQMIELNQQQLMTESEELKQVKIELSDLIENLKIYQQNLNLKPEIVSLGDRLANSITEQLGNNSRVLGEFVVKEGAKNKQDILSLYQNIEQSFLNLREINTKLTNLVELANQSPDNPKNRFKKST
jgi:chromosome segregation ATPase